MTIKEIETRCAEIREAMTSEDADIKSLLEEARSLKVERENLAKEEAEMKAKEIEAEKRAETIEAVISGEGTKIEKPIEEKRTMEEIRNSKEYIDAYAEYIKTGDATECRALLSENATNGTIPVPELVYDRVKTAWEKDGIMSRIRKTYVKGNLKVGYEVSSDGAVVHTEGGNAIDPENLVIGTVTLVPASIKKLVQVSDEALDLGGEAFLDYIYDEVAYQIAKKAGAILLADITDGTGVPVGSVQASTIGLDTIAQGMALLSAEAVNPVVIMNRQTWGAFKSAQAQGSFGYDPFEGLDVVFSNDVTAYGSASTGDTYAIVGDLANGAIANFPNGEDIKFKFDDLSGAAADMVNVIGRMFVGIGVVAPNAFVKITK